jgi:hypothetical protein
MEIRAWNYGIGKSKGSRVRSTMGTLLKREVGFAHPRLLISLNYGKGPGISSKDRLELLTNFIESVWEI